MKLKGLSMNVWLLDPNLDKNLQVSLSIIFPVSLPLLSRDETNCSFVNTGYLQVICCYSIYEA